jgi:peroxiredoxin (alkyl hydroperoxide reductase subunit C)
MNTARAVPFTSWKQSAEWVTRRSHTTSAVLETDQVRNINVLTVGDQFPAFSVTAVAGGDLSGVDANNPYGYFVIVSGLDHPGQWRVILFWPRDIQLASQTEVASFGGCNDEFTDRHTQLLGVSVDNKYAHFYWRTHQEELKTLPFPVLSDFNHALSAAAGVLNPARVADRAIFIVDPANEIRYVSVCSGSAVRNAEDILRVLDDLQSEDLGVSDLQTPQRPRHHRNKVA